MIDDKWSGHREKCSHVTRELAHRFAEFSEILFSWCFTLCLQKITDQLTMIDTW